MENNSMARAHAYYTLVGEKDVEGIKQYLHPDVKFSSPLSSCQGKDAVVKATTGFMNTFKSLSIRAKFGSEDQAIIVYDVDIPGIAQDFSGVSLVTFDDGLIAKIELFFDASSFRASKAIQLNRHRCRESSVPYAYILKIQVQVKGRGCLGAFPAQNPKQFFLSHSLDLFLHQIRAIALLR